MSEQDRIPTERINPGTSDLDRLDTLGVLERLNDEDRLVAVAVRAALPAVARAVDLAVEKWRSGGRIVLFGAGTSGRLALLDAAELGPTFGVPPDRYLARLAGGAKALQLPVEGAEDDRAGGEAAARDLSPRDVAFGIAASGRTPWVLGAMCAARSQGATSVGLTASPGSPLTTAVDVSIVVDTGPEVIAGSTRLKAGTAQKLVLNSFSTALMVRLGKVYENLMIDVQVTNEKLRQRAVRLVERIAEVDRSRAEAALWAAGDVKTAVVALRRNVTAPVARERLARADGNLRRVLHEGVDP